VIKSYLILLFVLSFLFSFNSEAKIFTAKEVKAIKAEQAYQKQMAKILAKKSSKHKKINHPKIAKKETKKSPKTPRKVVKLDFDKKKSAKIHLKNNKEMKKIAKHEKNKKKSFKAISCKDGYIVGQKAFCSSTTAKNSLLKKKGSRSLASKNAENKKLK